MFDSVLTDTSLGAYLRGDFLRETCRRNIQDTCKYPMPFQTCPSSSLNGFPCFILPLSIFVIVFADQHYLTPAYTLPGLTFRPEVWFWFWWSWIESVGEAHMVSLKTLFVRLFDIYKCLTSIPHCVLLISSPMIWMILWHQYLVKGCWGLLSPERRGVLALPMIILGWTPRPDMWSLEEFRMFFTNTITARGPIYS